MLCSHEHDKIIQSPYFNLVSQAIIICSPERQELQSTVKGILFAYHNHLSSASSPSSSSELMNSSSSSKPKKDLFFPYLLPRVRRVVC